MRNSDHPLQDTQAQEWQVRYTSRKKEIDDVVFRCVCCAGLMNTMALWDRPYADFPSYDACRDQFSCFDGFRSCEAIQKVADNAVTTGSTRGELVYIDLEGPPS